MASVYSGHKILRISGVLLCLVPESVSQVRGQPEVMQNAPIGVHFYNDSEVPEAELFAAQRVAQKVLLRANVDVAWQDCTVRANPSRLFPACASHLRHNDLVLYFVTRLEAHALGVGKNALGFSIIPDNNDEAQIAYVCYSRVRGLSYSTSFTPDELLGLAIAHEIGHLLLGTNEHSDRGILRERWRTRDLEKGYWEEFLFTPEQAQRLQRAVKTRVELEERGSP